MAALLCGRDLNPSGSAACGCWAMAGADLWVCGSQCCDDVFVRGVGPLLGDTVSASMWVDGAT